MIYFLLYLLAGFVFVCTQLNTIFTNSLYGAPRKHQVIYVFFLAVLLVWVGWPPFLILKLFRKK